MVAPGTTATVRQELPRAAAEFALPAIRAACAIPGDGGL